MRRLLACSVALEMVVGGLTLAALSGGTGLGSRSFDSPRAATLADASRADSGSGGARRAKDIANHRFAASTSAAPGNESSASGDDGDTQAESSIAGGQISFKEPIDFATGAVPSSAAFNVAHGDQMPLNATMATPLIDAVAVGDFNRDGKPDVAQTNVIAGTVSVFLGDGAGGFEQPRQHHVGAKPVFVVAGDLDLDGRLDLAVADYGSNDVAILAGDGDGSFQPAFFVPVPAPRNVAIGEFNGDDYPDLAVASSARSAAPAPSPSMGGVAIVVGNKAGSFSPAQFIATTTNGRPVNANYVAVGDFNNSGSDDLAVGVGVSMNAGDQQASDTKLTGDDVLVFLNRDLPLASTEQPFTSPTEQQRIRVGALPNAIAVSDLNHDTYPDLAVLDCGSGDITTLLGDGQGHFVVKATNVTVGGIPNSLSAGDFNTDGLSDLVTANWSGSTVSVLQGNDDGTFQPAVNFWSGDATTSTAVGDFNGDGRADVVVGRLRNDHLALLLNDSPQPGDGVVITRDIPYGSPTHPTNDPLAAHHSLDVYSPPEGTPSFAGPGRPCPVVLYAHGGGGVTGTKAMVSHLMRSLAVEGIVAVSIDYRLGPPVVSFDDQTKDLAQAFRWTRDNVGSSEFRGDPRNIFVAGTSNGAVLAAKFATGDAYGAGQNSVRGLVVTGSAEALAGNASYQPPSLLFNGSEGLDAAITPVAVAFSADSRRRGADSRQVTVAGRDHLTLPANLGREGDPGRVVMINFLRSHLANP